MEILNRGVVGMKSDDIFLWFVKWIILLSIFSLLLCVMIYSCQSDKEAKKHANETKTSVIEEKDGCKVYQIDRTDERGFQRWPVYFTNCQGTVNWNHQYLDGKIIKNKPFQNQTTFAPQGSEVD